MMDLKNQDKSCLNELMMKEIMGTFQKRLESKVDCGKFVKRKVLQRTA